MRAHDQHGDREIFRGPRDSARAYAVWQAQRELAIARARPVTAVDPPRDPRREALAAVVAAGQAALGGRDFRVPTETLSELRRRIEQLDRRARRLRTSPITIHEVAGTGPDGRTFVVLTGHAPVLAGWSLAAIIDHRDGQASLRAVSELGERLAAREFTAPRCEHCGLRRRRAETFVVVHAQTGETRQVGSGCLRDFLAGHDPDRACRQAEYLALARNTLGDADRCAAGRGGSGTVELPLETSAAYAAHVVRAHGWVSREQARRSSRPATADAALRAFATSSEAPDLADRALAAGALRWARALLSTKPEPTAFERDALAVVTSGRTLACRERGLVCALIADYRRRRGRSRHLGRPGAWIDITVLVERVVERPSARHGTVRRCELLDANFIRLVWWQIQGAPLREGEVLALHARVERHTHFGTTAVTVLAHCRRARTPATTNSTARMEASDARSLTSRPTHPKARRADALIPARDLSAERRQPRQPVRRVPPR